MGLRTTDADPATPRPTADREAAGGAHGGRGRAGDRRARLRGCVARRGRRRAAARGGRRRLAGAPAARARLAGSRQTPRQGAAEAAPAARAQAVAGEGRALQVLKAGRLNLLPASVTLSASAVRFAAAPGAAPRGAAGGWAPAVAPGPAAEGLVFEAAALDALAARSGELQAEHVRAVL